jgi:anthranilate/para-aminobenzoate synthase component II
MTKYLNVFRIQILKINVTADDGTIMAVLHKEFLVEGVQFHPESIQMKPKGISILKNFLEL